MRNPRRFNWLLLTGAILSAGLISCTRAAKDTKSTISFSVPQGAQSFDTLVHVSVNITGNGIPAPILFNWDRDKGGSAATTTTTSPSSFTFDIPQGPDRLIQILAVYGDSSSTSGSGAMKFYYGDITKTLAAAVEDVPVIVTSVGAGAAIISGQVQGRYLTSAADGPTSPIDIVYVPPGGKTPMIVERSMMMSGWFQFFGLIGAQLGYRMQDGSFLWGGPVDLSETSFPVSNRVMRAALPVHLRSDNNSGTITTHLEDPNVYIYGFFGDPTLVSAKSVCKSTGVALTRLLKVGTTTALTMTDANSADPSNLFDITLGFINLRGGVALGGAAPCDTQVNIAANLFGSALGFKSDMLENGGDSSAGFRLPFQLPTSNNNGGGSVLTSTVVDADNISVSGTLLPGTANVLDNFSVYKATNLGMNFYYHSSFASCEALPGMGFTKVSDTPVSGSAYKATLPLSDAEASGGAMFALCPTKAGAPVGPGVWVYASYMRGAGGCPGCGGGVATQLAAVMLGSKVANSVCTPFFIEGRDASNHPANFNGSMSLTFALDNADTTIYSDAYCMSSITAPYSVFSPSQTFYLKRTPTGAVPRNLTVSSSLPILNQPLSFVDSAGTPFIMTRTQPTISAYGCYTAAYVAMLQNGADTMVGNLGGSYNVILPTTTGLTYYYNSGPPCSTPGSGMVSLGMGSTSYINSINFSYSGVAPSISLDGTSASGSPPFTGSFSGASSVTVTQPGPATSVRLSMSNSFGAESCQSANLLAVDSMNNLSPTPQAISLSFTYNGSGTLPTNAGFYSDPSCTTPVSTPSIAINATQSSALYFRWVTPGALTINATITNGPAGISFQSYTANVGPTVLQSIVAYPSNGVSFAWPSTFAGYALPVQKGQPFNITLEARSPLGNLIMGFNDTNAGPSGVNIQDTYSGLNCGPILWTAGQGTVTCSVPNAPDYFSSLLDQLKTGGGTSMYPMYYAANNIRVSRAAEEVNTMSYLLSKPFSYSTSTCQPLMVARGQFTGNHFISSRVNSGMIYNAALSFGTGVTGFYSDASCGVLITQASLVAGNSAALVYAKMNGTPPLNNLAMQADFVGVADYGTTALSFSIAAAPSTFSQYNISMSLYQYYHSCSPVMVVRADANGAAVSAGAAESVTFSSTGFAGSWYSDASCATALAGSSTSFNVGESAKLVYIRPDVPNFTGGSVGVTNGTQTGTVTGIMGQP